MTNARRRLTFAGKTTLPPRVPFYLGTWGTSRFTTPLPAHELEASS
jgi:hypothetical protein